MYIKLKLTINNTEFQFNIKKGGFTQPNQKLIKLKILHYMISLHFLSI